MIVTIVNQKGGVGKTTLTVNVADHLRTLARLEGDTRPVLIVDLDMQGNSTKLSGTAPQVESVFDALVDPDNVPLQSVITQTALEGVVIAPSSRALAGLDSALRDVAGKEVLLRELLEPIAQRYAFIVIDNGPSLGLPIAIGLTSADIALVPVSCDGPMALEGLDQVTKTIELATRRQNRGLKRCIVLTRIDGRTSHSRPLAASIRRDPTIGKDVLQAEIGESADLQRAMFNRKTGGAVSTYAPQSNANSQFAALAAELRTI